MKSIVLFDSLYGNTKEIAKTISNELTKSSDTKLLSAQEISLDDLKNIDLLIVGSPTHGGTMKISLLEFLKQIPQDMIKGVKIATFDTRFLEKDLNFALKLLVKTIGYASPKIQKLLISKGGEPITKPMGFIVKGKEGPLAEKELEKSIEWIQQIVKLLN